jgi:glycosyltransferase involved in cell wall biosynthesis
VRPNRAEERGIPPHIREQGGGGMSRILMVGPYPPVRDGIAAYAVQEVQRLRAEGHDVEVLSPGPSAAHHHVDLRSPRGPLALAKRVRRYDRVIVQYHPDVFYPLPVRAGQRFVITAGLALAFALARHVELRVHEIDYRHGRPVSPNGWLARVALRAADRITVHTEPEQREIARAYGLQPDRVEVVEHGAHFLRRTALDRAGARRRLRLPDDELMFLSIGFIQPHKGFDRAVRAFAGMDQAGCRLDVVGSVRVEEEEYLDHAEDLRALVQATPGAHLHERFVGDEEFDVWLVAADVVVLPYRHIWSSSVASRAALYRRPVIATRVGGLHEQLHEQLPDDTVLVEDDHELAAAMRRAAAGRLGAPVEDTPGDDWAATGEASRDAVQAAVQRRARRDRGGRPPLSVPGAVPTGPRGSVASGGRPGDGRGRRRRAGLGTGDPADALRRLPAAQLPPPTSARPLAGTAKRFVRRLTWWELDPLVRHVNALQRSVLDALDALADRRAEPAGGDPGGDPDDHGHDHGGERRGRGARRR